MQDKYGPKFVYELSCDQMCGKGHTGMRGTVVVETQEEFDRWLASKTPQYYAAFPDKDPTKGLKQIQRKPNATASLIIQQKMKTTN